MFVLSLPYCDAVYCQVFPENARKCFWRSWAGL